MLSFFPQGVLDEILNLIESVSEGFPSYSCRVVLKKLLTYFEMLIVPHALQRVDGAFLYFTAFDILLPAY